LNREIKKVKETKKIFDKMGYDLNKYENFVMIHSGMICGFLEDVYL
jgi:ABC-type branched-subunit amino acid transport system permease subunit